MTYGFFVYRSLDHALATTHSSVSGSSFAIFQHDWHAYRYVCSWSLRSIVHWRSGETIKFGLYLRCEQGVLCRSVFYSSTFRVGGKWRLFLHFHLSNDPPRHYEKSYRSLVIAETVMDLQARFAKMGLWLKGLFMGGGFRRAHDVAAGLAIAWLSRPLVLPRSDVR